MNYLVSNNLDPPEGVQKLSIGESLSMISSWPVVQFDTETTGLDPHVNALTSMQFGYKDFKTDEITTIVVDCNSTDPKVYKDVIEKSYLIGHNLKFDLEFLYNFDIVPLKVYDTMIIEQLLYLGYKASNGITYNLGDVLYRNTGIQLDKSFQSEIATKGLTAQGIIYAGHDVMYLQDLRKNQMQIAEGRKCTNAYIVENRFVPAIAYLEWCGIRMDVDKWKKKMEADKEELNKCEVALDEYVKSNSKLNTTFVESFTQPSIFDTDLSMCEPKVTVDWNSPSKVVPVAKALGFNTTVIDKKTKKPKETVEEKVLSTQKGIDDTFLKLYFDYKGAEKNVSSYGQGHLNLINPNTGRLHTKFSQFGTVTGRMSSGSASENKDLALLKGLLPKDVKFVNLQNLPARGEAGVYCRSCFISSATTDFVSCDYSAEESRVQADVWNEKKLLDAFENKIDTHNLYAKLCFPEELKDVDVKDVKKVRPDLRQAAKAAEFGVSYGSDGTALASSVGMPVEKAKAMVQELIKGMPGMAKFKKDTANFLKKNGYILLNPITGHRVYWPEWSRWKAITDSFDNQFWTDYKALHKGTGDAVCKKVQQAGKLSKDWFEKNVLNYPIQGGSAIVLKQAAADLFEWIVKHGYFGKILLCVAVHDELDFECPKELTENFTKVLQDTMQKAAAKYYKKLPIPAEASVGDHWIH